MRWCEGGAKALAELAKVAILSNVEWYHRTHTPNDKQYLLFQRFPCRYTPTQALSPASTPGREAAAAPVPSPIINFSTVVVDAPAFLQPFF
jgi:hypothetical protein